MEKIKDALLRAREQRTQPANPGADTVSNVPDPKDSGASAPESIVYTRTRQIEVDPDYLCRNRVISSLVDPIAEPYKLLRTKVLQSMRANDWRSLAITSPTSGSGKTLTAINLAISIAREVNQTVLLVDLDLRQPRVQRYFTPEDMPGISDYLLQDVTVADLFFNPKGIDRLVVLPGHESVPHSSELLSSPKMVNLMNELKSRYPSRLVLLDMPPVLSSDDVLAFSPNFNAVLLVAEHGATGKEELSLASKLLEKTNVLGSVLNKVP